MNTVPDKDNRSSNPSSFFTTPDLNQRIDLIKHLLANTSLIPFVQATDGSGKSSLCNHLETIFIRDYLNCRIGSNEIAGIPDIRVLIARAAGMRIDETITDEKLKQHLAGLKKTGRPFLLMMDDIDQLSAEPLAWMMNFFASPELAGKAKLVVFSSLDLLALPLSPLVINQLKQVMQILDIPSFTKEQTREFILFLSSAPGDMLDEEKLAVLHKDSGGKPGKIIWQLTFAAEQGRQGKQAVISQTISSASPLTVIGIILMLSVVGTGLFFQEEINRFIAEAGKAEPEPEAELKTLQLPQRQIAKEVDDKQQTVTKNRFATKTRKNHRKFKKYIGKG